MPRPASTSAMWVPNGYVSPVVEGATRAVQTTRQGPHAHLDVNAAIPPGLSEIVMKAMSVDKARRFQSMDELRSALEKYL